VGAFAASPQAGAIDVAQRQAEEIVERVEPRVFVVERGGVLARQPLEDAAGEDVDPGGVAPLHRADAPPDDTASIIARGTASIVARARAVPSVAAEPS